MQIWTSDYVKCKQTKKEKNPLLDVVDIVRSRDNFNINTSSYRIND